MRVVVAYPPSPPADLLDRLRAVAPDVDLVACEYLEDHGRRTARGTADGAALVAHPPPELTAEQMETKADVTLEKQGDGFAITSVHLALTAKIPGADNATFQELAGKAKAGCPVSKLLNTKITLDATLA